MIIVISPENPTVPLATHDDLQLDEIRNAYPAEFQFFRVSSPVSLGSDLPEDAVEISRSATVSYTISKRQFATQAALSGMISEAEAEAFLVANMLPAIISTFISTLPAEQQFIARMKAVGALEYRRDDPMVLALAALKGLSATQMDAFWSAAHALV